MHTLLTKGTSNVQTKKDLISLTTLGIGRTRTKPGSQNHKSLFQELTRGSGLTREQQVLITNILDKGSGLLINSGAPDLTAVLWGKLSELYKVSLLSAKPIL